MTVQLIDELVVLLRARCTLIVMTARDERRALRFVQEAGLRTGQSVAAWDSADGFCVLQGDVSPIDRKTPDAALKTLNEVHAPAIFVLCGFQAHWDNNKTCRLLLNLCLELRERAQNIIVLQPPNTGSSGLPPALEELAEEMVLPPPSVEELSGLLESAASSALDTRCWRVTS